MALTEYQKALVSASQNGNETAFGALYQEFYGKVFSLARATVKNEADAEDILQRSFLLAWQNLSKLNDPEAFAPWIFRITVNQCYSLMRSRKEAISLDNEDNEEHGLEEPESDLMLPEAYAEQADLGERLKKVIASLSLVQRQTIELFYYEEMSVEEIASVMNVSPGTVKSRLFLARKGIRTEIEEIERKSGEKFFLLAGTAVVSLAFLYREQASAQSIPAGRAAEIFSGLKSLMMKDAAGAFAGTGAVGPGAAAGTGSMAGAGTTAGAGTAAGSAVAGAAVKTAGSLFGLKLAVIIVSAVLVLGGGFFGLRHLKGSRTEESAAATETAVNETSAEAPVNETSSAEASVNETTAAESESSALPEEEELFSRMQEYTFLYTSGIGGWGTVFTIDADGYFEGDFSDWDATDGEEPAPPNGVQYYCEFTGKFGTPEKLGDGIYRVRLESLDYDRNVGSYEIIDGMKNVVSAPRGLEGSEEFIIYAPEARTDEVAEAYLEWVEPLAIVPASDTLDSFGIYGGENAGSFCSYIDGAS